MVGKTEQDNARTVTVWPRVIAMFTSFMLVAIVFTAVAFLYPPVEAPKPDPPHIIFILADDLGWNDVSVHGSPQIPTPNLDALAASGVLLNNYYTGPLCSPSRGALLAGKYPHRLGLNRDLRPTEPSGLPLNVNILPGYLKKLGYAAHMVGKWHLGYYKKDYLPTRRGFDSFFGFLNDNIDYYDYTCYYKEALSENNDIDENDPESSSKKNSGNPVELFGIDLWENEEVVRDFRGEYVTDVLTDKALDVIEDHNVTKPLFLFVSEAATRAGNPFFPLQSPADLYERNNHIGDVNRRTYAGVVSSLDDSIGRIFEALNKKDMLRKSILVVSSDNGAGVGAGSNWPLRGAKASLWEGGVRSLALVWSPLLKLKEPRVSQNLMHITDWLPSLYYAAGGDVSDLGDIDGINMWPVLLKSKSPRDEVLLQVDPEGGGALRKGDYKLLVRSAGPSDWYALDDDSNVTAPMDDWVWANGSVVKNILVDTDQWLLPDNSSTWRQDASVECGENFLPVSGKCDFALGPCLYNIKEDPCEYKNIANLYPEIVEKLLDRLRDLNASTLPVESQTLDPLGNPLCHDFAHVPWVDEEEFDCPLI